MSFSFHKIAGIAIGALMFIVPVESVAVQVQPGGAMPTQQSATTPTQLQPQMPAGFPLRAEDQQFIEQLLSYWEGASSQIDRYRCEFTRWQFDPDICNYRNPENNRLVAAVISKGKVRYSTPDKGMYEVLEQWQFVGPPKSAGADPEYNRPSLENPDFPETEKWICDGEKIYEYDFQNKRLYEFTLPPEAQGEGLKNSPLPFVFGAKAAELLERYWIRDVTPRQLHGEQYWLEVWPKRVQDAQAYSRVEIILTREPFLPLSIHMYAPNYDPRTNPSKMVFQFDPRQINGTLDNLADFTRNFINPRTPLGWERIPRTLIQSQSKQQVPHLGQASGATANPGSQGR